MPLQDLLNQNLAPDYDQLGAVFEEELEEAALGVDQAMLADVLERLDQGDPAHVINYGVEVEDPATKRRYVIRVTLIPEVQP